MIPTSPRVALRSLLAVACVPLIALACGAEKINDVRDCPDPNAGTISGGSAGTGGKGSSGKSTGDTHVGGTTTDSDAGAAGESGTPQMSTGGTAGMSGGSGGKGGTAGTGGNAGAGGGGKPGSGGGGNGGGGNGGGGNGGGGNDGGGSGGKGGSSGASGSGAGGAGSGGGGSGGTAGGNQGPGCGNGVVDDGETCDVVGGDNYMEDDCGDIWGAGAVNGSANDCQVITPMACLLCEEASECAELLDSGIATGNATEGPAVGRPRHALYNETLDCVRDTGCAKGAALDCYCGTVSSSQCDAGNGNGVCRTVIERGLETTNPTEISNRFSNVTLGGGVALARIACDKNNCDVSCGLSE